MDNIIDLNSTSTEELIKDRSRNCYNAHIALDFEHITKCKYCIANDNLAKMIFEILKQDMITSSINKKLEFTSIDMKIVLQNVLTLINFGEYQITQKKEHAELQKTEETREGSVGTSSGPSSGSEALEETSVSITEGVIEIGSYRKTTRKD